MKKPKLQRPLQGSLNSVATLLTSMQLTKLSLFRQVKDNFSLAMARKIEAAEKLIGDELTKQTCKPEWRS